MVSRNLIRIVKANRQLFWMLLVVALMPVIFNHTLLRWWNFRQIESQLQTEMDPIKVQLWATNILAQHYWDKNVHYYPRFGSSNILYSYPSWSGTNLPPGALNM